MGETRRFLVIGDLGVVDAGDLDAVRQRLTRAGDGANNGTRWQHTHVVREPDGNIRAYAIFTSPDAATARSALEGVDGLDVTAVAELGDDAFPEDFA